MIKAIVSDIEGTIGSISFVREVLFPYAAWHLPAYIRENRTDPRVREQLNAVAEQTGIAGTDPEGLIQQLLDWIESDTKATPLKALQGMVWEYGYKAGDYKAHIYQDAIQNLTEWHAQKIGLYIFSSGSVQAQELFFQYSCYGDLRPLFSDCFDTTTGPKVASESYRAIAAKIGLPTDELLFLSDTEAELDAAKEAGLNTTWLIRPQDSALAIEGLRSAHPLVRSFDDIAVQAGQRFDPD